MYLEKVLFPTNLRKMNLTSLEEESIRSAVANLSDQLRVIIWLKYWENYDFNEIAKIVGLDLRELIINHDKALQILKVQLTNIGMTVHVAS